jgi:hypothetical protein
MGADKAPYINLNEFYRKALIVGTFPGCFEIAGGYVYSGKAMPPQSQLYRKPAQAAALIQYSEGPTRTASSSAIPMTQRFDAIGYCGDLRPSLFIEHDRRKAVPEGFILKPFIIFLCGHSPMIAQNSCGKQQ